MVNAWRPSPTATATATRCPLASIRVDSDLPVRANALGRRLRNVVAAVVRRGLRTVVRVAAISGCEPASMDWLEVPTTREPPRGASS